MRLHHNEVRALSARTQLDYTVLTPKDMQILRTFIHPKMKDSGSHTGTFRCRQRATIGGGYGG